MTAMSWLKARLGEHSTQVAIGGAVVALGNALIGSITWQTAAVTVAGLVIPAVMPATSTTK